MIENLNRYFDHTLLKPDAQSEDIRRLCGEAKQFQFYAVCVNSSHVALAKAELQGSGVRVCAVAGFPLGAAAREVKLYETAAAVRAGADEIDMVINIGALKEGRDFYVRDEIAGIVSAAEEQDARVKVIIEAGILSDEEIFRACFLAKNAGAAFVKTSTGFGYGGAQVRHVELMRGAVGEDMGVKASGGIGDLETVIALIRGGADRIGASRSVDIMREWIEANQKA